mmetsp:Transcript_4580/g.12310  ORF Transcript_4580/g.12310 Transcript_4580/m.12310 type:complete len:249 (+) Transcript_4580:1181-1927(+)
MKKRANSSQLMMPSLFSSANLKYSPRVCAASSALIPEGMTSKSFITCINSSWSRPPLLSTSYLLKSSLIVIPFPDSSTMLFGTADWPILSIASLVSQLFMSCPFLARFFISFERFAAFFDIWTAGSAGSAVSAVSAGSVGSAGSTSSRGSSGSLSTKAVRASSISSTSPRIPKPASSSSSSSSSGSSSTAAFDFPPLAAFIFELIVHLAVKSLATFLKGTWKDDATLASSLKNPSYSSHFLLTAFLMN